MTSTRPTPDLDVTIARVLTVGTYVAIGLLAAGAFLLLASGRSPLDVDPPADLPSALVDLSRPEGWLWLGLVAVIATPTARVALALAGYARLGDRSMALVALGILGIIGISVLLGISTEA